MDTLKVFDSLSLRFKLQLSLILANSAVILRSKSITLGRKFVAIIPSPFRRALGNDEPSATVLCNHLEVFAEATS